MNCNVAERRSASIGTLPGVVAIAQRMHGVDTHYEEMCLSVPFLKLARLCNAMAGGSGGWNWL
jgi:hypothetical protein